MTKIITVSDLISEKINDIISNKFYNNDCKPVFIISKMDHNLILTLTHLGWSHSAVIGYETDIEFLVMDLYNRTM